jgi:hypothetical protein
MPNVGDTLVYHHLDGDISSALVIGLTADGLFDVRVTTQIVDDNGNPQPGDSYPVYGVPVIAADDQPPARGGYFTLPA